MMKYYSQHKRFIRDVVRAVDPDKISDIVSHYIPLRASEGMRDLSDQQVFSAVQMITDTELDEVYPFLYQDGLGLSDHQIIFRIKRIKYITSTKESMTFLPTRSIIEVGRNIGTSVNSHIMIEHLRVIKISEEPIKIKREKKNREKILEFALKNIKWTGRDGHFNDGTISAKEGELAIEKELGVKMTALQLRAVLRKYFKDKPIIKVEDAKNEDTNTVVTE